VHSCTEPTLDNARFEVFTAVTMKNGIFGMLCRVGLVKTDVSEELSASFIRVTRMCELGTTLTVGSNRHLLLVTASYYSFCVL
jgi:hypothetical protein